MVQLIDSLLGNVLCRIEACQSLNPLADIHDIHQIISGDSKNHRTLSAVLNKALLFQAAQRFTDRGATNTQSFRQLHFGEDFSTFINAIDNVIFQFFKNLVSQGCCSKILHVSLSLLRICREPIH